MACVDAMRLPATASHFGLVVDDKEAVRKALAEIGIKLQPGRFLDFLDPWGNRIEIVAYDNIQFSKAPNVLRGMGPAHLYRQGYGSELKMACAKAHNIWGCG